MRSAASRPVPAFGRSQSAGLTLLALLALLVVVAPARAALSHTAYVTNANGNSVVPIAIPSNTVGAAITVGAGPVAVALSPSGATAYVADIGDSSVSVIDTATNTVTATIPVGNSPFSVAVAPDGATAYVANVHGNSVSVIDTSTNTVTATIPVGNFPEGVAVTPDGGSVLVANNGSGTVSRIDTATNTVTTTVTTASFPSPIAITPDDRTAYVGEGAGLAGAGVQPIEVATNTVGASVPTGHQPNSIAIAPDGSTAYVANFVGGSVSVVDLATNTVTATLSGAPLATPTTIAITPDGSIAYVVDFNANKVIPIDTRSNTVGAPITGFSGPEGIAITPDQPPVAALSATAAAAGQATSFDASASIDPDGTIAFYHWDFGDGTPPATTTTPTTTHTYATVGSYTATVTETDDEGCSNVRIFTGQTVSCNGSSVAQATQGVSVSPAPTTTTLAASPVSPSVFGQSVAFTATVTGGDGGGTVVLKDGATTIAGCGAIALTGSGPYTATCTTSTLAVGSPHSIVATYSGDPSSIGSASTALPYTVNQAPTTTTLAASPAGSSVFGQPVTFTATVTGGDGGGTVAFKDGAATVAGCGAIALSGSGPYIATCNTSTLAVGSHSIVATYSGDGSFTGSTSTALPYTVNKAATTTTITASPASPSVFGQSVTFTATVAAAPPGAGTPTGTVAFTVDGTPVGSFAISGSGQATLSTSSLSAGSHTITATYSGDGNFLSSSGSLPYTVTCAVTVSGTHSGSLEVTSSTCIAAHAVVNGAIVVNPGASLDLEGASVNGAISATGGSGVIRVCGSSIGGAVDIKNRTSLVMIGDPGDAACAPNTIAGILSLKNNTGGVEAINNIEHGLINSGNSGPGPFPGDPTTISGNHS
jgi:YVTN family beta-propeller protein